MTAITERYRYRLNGILDPNNNVLANMEQLANSCASWISYDMFSGLWDVVINRPEPTVAAFNDSNIIGSISLNATGLKEMYNAVEVRFPHSDLDNQQDYIRIDIPVEDRLPNEPDNILTIDYSLLNDPVQAQLLGLIELKQSRLDKVVVFQTDYSMVNLAAGSVISLTSSLYGWNAKLFRIITIREIAEEGALSSEITALEYNANIYDTSDLYRYARTNASGIVSIGAIGKPDQPQVSKFETASRPGILIEAEVPGGLVNAIEYWLTYDVPPGVGSDENRNYTLIGTIYAPQGGTLTQGDTAELNYDGLDASNFLIKVRGRNDEVTGPFSDPSGLIEYIPTQVTDAIGSGTTTLDDAGNPIAGLLAANALMALLGELFNGSSAEPGFGGFGNIGSIFDKVFGVYDDVTGIDMKSPEYIAGIEAIQKSNGKVLISASSGKITTGNLSVGNGTLHSTSFTCDVTGEYKIDVILDQNGSGARGGRGSDFGEPADIVGAGFELTQGSTVIAGSSSGGVGAFFWTDFSITDKVNLTEGVTYNLEFYYIVSTASAPTSPHNWDVSWNVYSVGVL